MNANEFWVKQLKKNESGKPKHTVYTDPATPEQELLDLWVDKWREQFIYFNNRGCGCCINIYEFDVAQEAVSELPAELVELYEEPIHHPRTEL